jgi:hypothetical protein
MTEGNGASPRPPYALPDELFAVQTTDGRVWTVDIIEAHIRQNQIIDEQKAHPEDEWWYLRALGEWLTSNGGPTGLRLAQLDRLWANLRTEFANRKRQAKVTTVGHAEFAEFFGFSAGGPRPLTRWELIGYQANMPRLEAKRLRQQLMTSGVRLSGKAIHDLVLAETEDKEKAEKALQDFIWAELKAGRKPEV